MNYTQLKPFIQRFLELSGVKIPGYELDEFVKRYQDISINNFADFNNVLAETGNRLHFLFNAHHLSEEAFIEESANLNAPLLVFLKSANSLEIGIIRFCDKKHIFIQPWNGEETKVPSEKLPSMLANAMDLCGGKDIPGLEHTPKNHIVFFSGYPVPSLLKHNHEEHLSPVARVFRLLKEEKQNISHIYFYAIMMGLVSLALPLGIQAIIGLISGGLFLNSVIVLMLLVVAATIVSGWIQVLQLSVVEVLQQRIFAKAAIEFAFRIPRLRIEGLGNSYAPELMNRFFDVLTIQKSLPKILIDLSTAGIQIIFGLILLSLYHPLFIILGIFITLFIVGVFYATGKKAIETDLNSSKYKYKVAYWIEELARTLATFKLAGNTSLPLQKMDKLLTNYLKYRQSHFNVLVKQFKAIIAFKTFITAGLLILGGVLVVDKQINLGQFVAAEVIILLVLSSVEKIISTLESVYDVITAADKVGHITDLELERENGIYLEDLHVEESLTIELRNLSYRYHDAKKPVLNNVNFTIHPGEKVCIAGFNGSGKSTLIKLVSGLLQGYDGRILINNQPLRQINLASYRSIVADNLSDQEIFEGTIEENITLNRVGLTLQDIQSAITKAGLDDFILSLEKGIYTTLEAGGTFLSKSNKQKLLLARSFVSKPKLLVIDEFFYNADRQEKERILSQILSPNTTCSLLIISNEKTIMEQCNKVILMQSGNVLATGTYAQLLNNGSIQQI